MENLTLKWPNYADMNAYVFIAEKKKSDLFLYTAHHCSALHMLFLGLQRCFGPERTYHKDEICVHKHEQGLGNKYIMFYKLPEQRETAARFFPSF